VCLITLSEEESSMTEKFGCACADNNLWILEQEQEMKKKW
jgi:hypothetical protein